MIYSTYKIYLQIPSGHKYLPSSSSSSYLFPDTTWQILRFIISFSSHGLIAIIYWRTNGYSYSRLVNWTVVPWETVSTFLFCAWISFSFKHHHPLQGHQFKPPTLTFPLLTLLTQIIVCSTLAGLASSWYKFFPKWHQWELGEREVGWGEVGEKRKLGWDSEVRKERIEKGRRKEITNSSLFFLPIPHPSASIQTYL